MKTSDGTGRNEAEDDVADVDLQQLLYVAGELDAAGRQRVEAGLAAEPSRRSRVAELQSMDAALRAEASVAAVKHYDSHRALVGTLRRLEVRAATANERPTQRLGIAGQINLPRWAWGTAVAALLAVGFVVWVTDSAPPQMTLASTSNAGYPRGEAWAQAFAPVGLATEEEAGGELDAQIQAHVDALGILAMMGEANNALDGQNGDFEGD